MLNTLTQIRGTIESLTCNNVDSQKAQLLDLIETLAPGHSNGKGPNDKHQRLSPRERQIMEMILEGRRLKEIAAVLDISVKTVTTHRTRLLRKLGIEDNLSLYRYGVRNGLISV